MFGSDLVFSKSRFQSLAVHADTQSSNDKIYFTASGGLSFADVSSYAASTAQLGANALGQTVTYSHDRATWGGLFGGGYELSDNLSLELNYFFTGDIDITNAIASGVAVKEAFSASGFDHSVKYNFDDSVIFVKAGMHNSDLGNSAAITLNVPRTRQHQSIHQEPEHLLVLDTRERPIMEM